ncbi:Secoisolariciresinol dehydrogenase [Vitis vinifera]|uniref:Secoisolariciresinol dehydrogenase n=1 Tax=Vitis vinifera TaxID=29760 RepID=A0A438DCZ6_VITVI|nr:Secoisolariciresinol dehydrogenase [Vitis vinifera]
MVSSSLLSSVARRLEGKVAVITGGAGGIGSCTAKLFCQHGAKVLIADIQDEKGHSICKDLGPTSASFVHCDVTKELDVGNAIDKAISKYGKLDIMFNNAGILGPYRPNILDNDADEFENTMRVNVLGTFLGTKHAARVMAPAGRGSIINTASVCSVVGGVATHSYTSSKHAILGLTRNTAVELGKFGIRVNCVSPYLVPTSLSRKFMNLGEDDPFVNVYSNLKGVSLEVEDVAEAVLYLGSDNSKYVSGHNLVLDGGVTILTPSNMFEM